MKLTKAKVVLGAIVGLILIVVISVLSVKPSTPKSSNGASTPSGPDSPYDAVTTKRMAEAQARAEASPEYQASVRHAQLAQKQAEAAEQTATVARLEAIAGASQIKESMKDPDSFQLKSATLMADHSACYEYSATNTFGGRMREYAVLTPKRKILFNDATTWNKYCTNKSGLELGVIQ
jgi:hypothetical protein